MRIASYVSHDTSYRAFTLVELMIVIAIIGILAAALFPQMSQYMARSRDTARLTQAQKIIAANELFRTDIGRYANPSPHVGCGGWDTPTDGIFLSELSNYVRFRDPDNGGAPDGTLSACGWIQYYRYAPGNGNCPIEKGAFYVIRIFRTTNSAVWNGPGFSCGGPNFDWATTAVIPGMGDTVISGQFENQSIQ